MTLSDDILIAYVDGQLSAEDRQKVEQTAAVDEAVAARIAAHRRVTAKVAGAYAPVLDEPVPEALLAMLGGSAAAEVLPFKPRRALPAWTTWAAMAACLVIGLAVGVGAPKEGLVAPDMTARGALASALDGQLASNPDGGAIRIGLTFTDKDGAYCRTFQAAEGVAGLACRQGDDWRVPVLSAQSGGRSGEFRTASSLPPAVAAAVDERIVGEPLDAAQEAKAKAAGWRL